MPAKGAVLEGDWGCGLQRFAVGWSEVGQIWNAAADKKCALAFKSGIISGRYGGGKRTRGFLQPVFVVL